MARVLGLDLSLRSTGVCVLDGELDMEPRKRSLTMKRDKTSSIKESIERLISISDDINQIINDESPDIVVIEAPAKNQVWQAANIGELHGVVKIRMFERFHIVPWVEQVTKLRKAVIGHISSKREKTKKKDKEISKVSYGLIPGKRDGKFKKATVKDIVELRLKERGLEFGSQDEVDAYICAKYAWDKLKG